ncbi:MAG: sulfotransferase [Rhodothermales bacterium]
MTQPEEHIDTNEALLEELSAVSNTPQAPIFILGMMPRSGTNFLHRLICQHPDCGAINTTPVREDYLTHHIKWLSRYVRRLQWQWGNWGADAEFVAPLSTSVGQGLTSFLQSLSSAQRIVTKTPSVENLSAFFDYFADAYLLVIVRDGRSLVASGMSGFGWNFETATRRWSKTARSIIDFKNEHPEFADRFKLVHYEALNDNTVQELRSVLTFLQLDADAYDFEAALDTPVYGSSFMKEEGKDMTWKPQEKKKDFNTKERWRSWGKFKHGRFNWIARRELENLGYESVGIGDKGVFAGMLHRAVDGVYVTKRLPGRMFRALREGSRAFVDSMKGKGRSKVNLKR